MTKHTDDGWARGDVQCPTCGATRLRTDDCPDSTPDTVWCRCGWFGPRVDTLRAEIEPETGKRHESVAYTDGGE